MSAAFAALLVLGSPSEGLAACTTTGTNQTCSNSVAISGNPYGINDTATLTLTNTDTGSVVGTSSVGLGYGIETVNANVSNWGTISGTGNGGTGGYGISASTTANVSNWGTISGAGGTSGSSGYGIYATTATVSNWGTISGTALGGAVGYGIYATTANVTNYGTISGTGTRFGYGIYATTANVTNYGTISGTTYGISASGSATITNSGTISGDTYALHFSGSADSLTLLPGSVIIGAIHLGGGNDTVNVQTGNQNLTFDAALTGVTVTSTVPYVVSGSRIVTVDPTPFAMTDRNLMDFTGAVSNAVPVLNGQGTTMGGVMPMAFAGPSNFDTAFDSVTGLSAYASAAPVLSNPTVRYADGTAVWGRAFAGERVQQEDGALMHTRNQFYGGMIGGDWPVQADLRLGAFLGGGAIRSTVDANLGNNKSELVFGGVYGRYDWGASFLNAAVQGGHIQTDVTRTINNNLVAGGLETATASHGGWYVNPEATYGMHYRLGSLAGATYTLTPSLNVRYLYASLGGYTESGTTTAPLTVGAQTVSDFEERGQLKLTRTQRFTATETLTTDLEAGVLGTQRAGSDTIAATLLGQAIPFTVPGKNDVWGGFGGAGLKLRKDGVELFGSAQYLVLSDSSSVVSGQGGVRVSF